MIRASDACRALYNESSAGSLCTHFRRSHPEARRVAGSHGVGGPQGRSHRRGARGENPHSSRTIAAPVARPAPATRCEWRVGGGVPRHEEFEPAAGLAPRDGLASPGGRCRCLNLGRCPERSPLPLFETRMSGSAFGRVPSGPSHRPAAWFRSEVSHFRQVDSAIKREPGKRLKRGALLKVLALELPEEDLERVFLAFVRWAQAGDLFRQRRAGRGVDGRVAVGRSDVRLPEARHPASRRLLPFGRTRGARAIICCPRAVRGRRILGEYELDGNRTDRPRALR